MKLLKNKKVLIGVGSVFVIAILITTLSLTLSSDNEIFQANVKEKETISLFILRFIFFIYPLDFFFP